MIDLILDFAKVHSSENSLSEAMMTAAVFAVVSLNDYSPQLLRDLTKRRRVEVGG